MQKPIITHRNNVNKILLKIFQVVKPSLKVPHQIAGIKRNIPIMTPIVSNEAIPSMNHEYNQFHQFHQ